MAEARDAEELIEMILKLAASEGHSNREVEPVFRVEPTRTRRRWRRSRRPAAEIMAGWRIGCYYRLASTTLQGGYRVRREFLHPVYLLLDGRLTVGAFRAVDAEGTVTELERHKRQPSWFSPLEDNSAFFAVLPGHYLDELRALYDDLT